ncbi:MAG: hypothetical protein U0235_31725 [Polyangiaceae bacterium]
MSKVPAGKRAEQVRAAKATIDPARAAEIAKLVTEPAARRRLGRRTRRARRARQRSGTGRGARRDDRPDNEVQAGEPPSSA